MPPESRAPAPFDPNVDDDPALLRELIDEITHGGGDDTILDSIDHFWPHAEYFGGRMEGEEKGGGSSGQSPHLLDILLAGDNSPFPPPHTTPSPTFRILLSPTGGDHSHQDDHRRADGTRWESNPPSSSYERHHHQQPQDRGHPHRKSSHLISASTANERTIHRHATRFNHDAVATATRDGEIRRDVGTRAIR